MKRIGNFNGERFRNNFEDRLIFQKTIYLLQAFGLYIGIPFSWYLHGPYSMVLANHGYSLSRKFFRINPVKFKSGASEKRFEEFYKFLGENKDNANWLEALASIHFLRNTYPLMSKAKIISEVIKKQPNLENTECEKAWIYLVKYNLIRERD